jgi:Predicted hydrolase of the alpha/beta superfamily
MRLGRISICTQGEKQLTSLTSLLRRRREGSKNPFGTIDHIDRVYSPELDNERDLLVSLPGGYSAGERRYPVIYMHDGQNLFDPATSFSGSWNVDVAMAEVSRVDWARSSSASPTWEWRDSPSTRHSSIQSLGVVGVTCISSF